MADDERTAEEPEETPEVEGHGTKHVVAGGLAAAALIGGTAAAVKLTDDDPSKRTAAALVESGSGDPKRADRDGDGYVTFSELAHEGFKFNVDELNQKGAEVSALGLAAAGYKLPLETVGGEGFAIKGESIYVKWGVDKSLDGLRESAIALTDKLRSVDRDSDGYATARELSALGWKFNVDELNEAGKKVSPPDLVKAGYKLPLQALGVDGFMIKGESIYMKWGVDNRLDELFKKI
jgi:hypothetical protein